MKKIVLSVIFCLFAVVLVACGNQTPSQDNVTNEGDAVVDQNQPVEDSDEIEIKVDYVAEKLGLTDESDVMYGLIGAIAGKQYSNGNVELYQFDENSDDYKDLINGKTYLTPAAYKDGMVLIFAFGVEADEDLINAFYALEF